MRLLFSFVRSIVLVLLATVLAILLERVVMAELTFIHQLDVDRLPNQWMHLSRPAERLAVGEIIAPAW
jgi:hypothetical protein